MWPYWFLFLVPAWLALTRLRPVDPSIYAQAPWSDWWRLVYLMLALMAGLRHEVGGDWFSYLPKLVDASDQTWQQALAVTDPAYGLLNWLAARYDYADGIYLVNLVCALIFTWGLVVFCRAQPRPWLTLVVAVPYLVTVVGMGYTRQGVAIGLAMAGLVALAESRLLRFVMLVALAATFHKSAVILMPLSALAGTRHRLWTVFWVSTVTAIFYVLLLADRLEALQYGYLEREYQSQGAVIRLAMNAVPAVLFLLFRRRFVMPPEQRRFWIWMSLGALALIAALAVSPSSTAVDRVALYWIPLQLFVLGRLPDALRRFTGTSKVWVHWVVLYSALVLLIWLTFASHAESWLPYQFYPWVMLWN